MLRLPQHLGHSLATPTVKQCHLAWCVIAGRGHFAWWSGASEQFNPDGGPGIVRMSAINWGRRRSTPTAGKALAGRAL